jgi:cell division protein FtsW (lipid II flippase)
MIHLLFLFFVGILIIGCSLYESYISEDNKSINQEMSFEAYVLICIAVIAFGLVMCYCEDAMLRSHSRIKSSNTIK